MFQFPLPAYAAPRRPPPLFEHHHHGGVPPPITMLMDVPPDDHHHLTILIGERPWRTLIDNCVIELIASLFINLATILCWPRADGGDGALQFVPALALGLALLCLKDEDYFFPDGSPTVTFVLWVLGGYAWPHTVARMLGQAGGFALALWICLGIRDMGPQLVHRVEHAAPIVFALEVIGTMIEHLAIIYVLLPLLPPASLGPANAAAWWVFPTQRKVKPKSHQDAQAPSNPAVLHAAVTFATLHWCLWRGFGVDMNPAVTLLIGILRGGIWDTVAVALWGQLVGLALAVVYAAFYVPREAKYWPARNLKH